MDYTPEIFLERVSAQKLALALLNLHWHPESYLIGRDKRGPVSILLTNPSQRLSRLMSRTIDKVHYLGLNQEDTNILRDDINSAYRPIEKSYSSYKRKAFASMYQLHQNLERLTSQPDQVMVKHAIGVLCLIN
jgi:hypothetical protein